MCGKGPLASAQLIADHVLGFEGPDDPLAWSLDEIESKCFECSGMKDGAKSRG
jgi:hypothetical protein